MVEQVPQTVQRHDAGHLGTPVKCLRWSPETRVSSVGPTACCACRHHRQLTLRISSHLPCPHAIHPDPMCTPNDWYICALSPDHCVSHISAEGPGRAGLEADLRGRPGGRRRLTQSWSFGASSGSISLLKRMAVCWSANMRSPQLELSLILWEKNSSSFQRSARSSVRVMSSMTERRRIEKPPLPPNGAAG